MTASFFHSESHSSFNQVPFHSLGILQNGNNHEKRYVHEHRLSVGGGVSGIGRGFACVGESKHAEDHGSNR